MYDFDAAITLCATCSAVKTLNQVYSSFSARRRYEVWFVRLGLADDSGAWWFRYLLLNPGRNGCTDLSCRCVQGTGESERVHNQGGPDARDPRTLPVQVWATWFPRDARPQTFIQGFSAVALNLSARGQSPFHFRNGTNQIEENSCRGDLNVDGHKILWDLRYRSTFRVTLSNKGWIGFSRTPHSDAVFSGRISIDGRTIEGDPLGFGVQGHNCGYRHRGFWTWAHAYLPRANAPASTLEALVYDMPFGLVFRRAVLWHDGREHVFRNLREIGRDHSDFRWSFHCSTKDEIELQASFDGTGPGLHRLPYVTTDCSGSFDVTNNSLATSVLLLNRGGDSERLETSIGAVLEMAGSRK